MTSSWTVPPASLAAMAGVALFTAALPLALGLLFRKRYGGRWRFFLLGCGVFFLFAMVLEGFAHSLVGNSPAGAVIQSNLLLYALYAGLMAGVFEECGRWLAFRLTRRGGSAGSALMCGAGHGGFEAVAITGLTMVNNLILASALNRGGLEAVEALTGPLSGPMRAALDNMVNAAPGLYLWAGFERAVAIALHISLSVLVYTAATRKGNWYWLPAAILIHALCDMAAVLTISYCPVAVSELVLLAMTAAAALLARRVFLRQRAETP